MTHLVVEEILKGGYDSIWLTEEGEANTRNFMHTPNLYGWDCECVCLLTHAPILTVNGEQVCTNQIFSQ